MGPLKALLIIALFNALVPGPSGAFAEKVVLEKRDVLPLDWVESHEPEPDLILPIRIGLKQANIERLEDFLTSVSHPDSSQYGQHWTPEQVARTFAPSPDTIEAVRGWLSGAGIAGKRLRLTPSQGWLHFNASVGEIEQLLDAKYRVYRRGSGTEHVACTSYSVPQYIQPHVDLITPTLLAHVDSTHQTFTRRASTALLSTSLLHKLGSAAADNLPNMIGPASGALTSATNLQGCDQVMTPNCVKALYNIKYKPVATDRNTFAIVEYNSQVFLQTDLDLFFQNFSTHQAIRSPEILSIDGGEVQTVNQSSASHVESALDLEYGMTLANPQPVQLYQVGDLVKGGSFNNLLDALDRSYCTFQGGDDPSQDAIYPDPSPGGFNQPESCGTVKPAHVISTSYTIEELHASPAYLTRQCNEYGKLGLIGTTVIYSSGDGGVAGHGNLCMFPNGTRSVDAPKFVPVFPPTCPFVTSVGATQLNPGAKVTDPESAWQEAISSGGGFSNVFSVPEYQKAAQAAFFAKGNPPYDSTQFNNSGNVRGYPDLSANGAHYMIAVDGNFVIVSGTSASTPVVASIITLVNDARLAKGKGPVGFINPTIYSPGFRSAFNDIVNGTNPGCGTPGFSAIPGWDPVTGVGTPNLGKLIEKWLELP